MPDENKTAQSEQGINVGANGKVIGYKGATPAKTQELAASGDLNRALERQAAGRAAATKLAETKNKETYKEWYTRKYGKPPGSDVSKMGEYRREMDAAVALPAPKK